MRISAARATALWTMVVVWLSAWGPAQAQANEPQLRTASADLSAKIKAANKKTIAVVDFTDLQMNVTELGRYLAEQMQEALFAEKTTFDIVDRTHLKALLQEHKLAASGIIDPLTARRLGEIAGVDCLLTGSLTPFGDTVRVSIKVLDAATAKVIGVASVDIGKTDAIAGLLGRGIGGADTHTTPPSGPSGAGASKGGVNPAAKSAGANLPSVTVDGVKLEARSCRRGGAGLQCDMLLTAVTDDQPVFVSISKSATEPTRAFDSAGTVHIVEGGTLAGKPPRGDTLNGTLISGVPTPLTLVFEDTTEPALPAIYVSILLTNGTTGGRSWKTFVVRNVRVGS